MEYCISFCHDVRNENVHIDEFTLGTHECLVPAVAC